MEPVAGTKGHLFGYVVHNGRDGSKKVEMLSIWAVIVFIILIGNLQIMQFWFNRKKSNDCVTIPGVRSNPRNLR